jgi:hypothetical protein
MRTRHSGTLYLQRISCSILAWRMAFLTEVVCRFESLQTRIGVAGCMLMYCGLLLSHLSDTFTLILPPRGWYKAEQSTQRKWHRDQWIHISFYSLEYESIHHKRVGFTTHNATQHFFVVCQDRFQVSVYFSSRSPSICLDSCWSVGFTCRLTRWQWFFFKFYVIA